MKKYLGNKAMIILFIAPVMLFMIVMVFYPLVVLMRNSFHMGWTEPGHVQRD